MTRQPLLLLLLLLVATVIACERRAPAEREPAADAARVDVPDSASVPSDASDALDASESHDASDATSDASSGLAAPDAGPQPFRCGAQTCRASQYCLEIAYGSGGAYQPGAPAASTIKLECWDSLGSSSVPCGPARPDRHARCSVRIPKAPPGPHG